MTGSLTSRFFYKRILFGRYLHSVLHWLAHGVYRRTKTCCPTYRFGQRSLLFSFFFFQDLIHYWYHRLAHEWEPLWNIHRVHHSPNSMNVMVTSRINFLWQLLMPVNYVSGIAIYLGLGEVFLFCWVFRACLNYLTHTEIRWDLPFYGSN